MLAERSCWADLSSCWDRNVVGRSFSLDFSGSSRARASALVGVEVAEEMVTRVLVGSMGEEYRREGRSEKD